MQTRAEDVAAHSVDVADFFRDGYGPLSTTGLSALLVSMRLELTVKKGFCALSRWRRPPYVG